MTTSSQQDKIALQRQRLELATGGHTLHDLRRHADLAFRRLEAEEKAGLEKVGGTLLGEDEDVGDIVIGDVTRVEQTSKMGSLLGPALLGAALAGPLSWMAAQRTTPEQPAPKEIMEDTDTDTANGWRILRDESGTH